MSRAGLLAAQVNAVERSARVKRYHTEPTLHIQTVGEHTYGVLWLVLLIEPGASRDLLVAALGHDTPEFGSGDVPSPSKKDPAVKAAFDAMESDTMTRLQLETPWITDTEARVLKLADNLEGLMFCLSEWRRGNRDIALALGNYIAYIATMQPQDYALTIFNNLKEQARELNFNC